MKSKAPDLIHIHIEMFDRHVYIFLGSSYRQIENYYRNTLRWNHNLNRKEIKDTIGESCNGFTCYIDDHETNVLIYLRKRPSSGKDFSILHHEIFHAIDFLANGIDEESRLYDAEGHSETRAYMGEYIISEFNREFSRH